VSAGGTNGPEVTVVVCTHNRAEYLERALESVVTQAVPKGGYELLVVDNGSSDGTAGVVRSFLERGPVRYAFEPTLGLCHARNTGWRAAKGRIVAYFDDDAIAYPGWLAAIPKAFALRDNVGVAGGRVEPIWQAARPGWLSDRIVPSLTVVDWSPTPREIPDLDREWLVGANMALPRTVLEDVGGFEAALDRSGTRMLSSGDVYLQKQVVRRGYRCVYYPEMAIGHVVPPSRLERAWFRRRYYWQGVSDVVMQLLDQSPSRATRLGLAARTAFSLLRSPRACWDLLVAADDPERFARACFTWIAVGRVAGYLGVART